MVIENYKKVFKFVEKTYADIKIKGFRELTPIPDIICCLNGRFIGIEVKRPGGKVSKLQELTLKKIETAGGIAIIAYSVEDVRKVINKLSIECG